MSNSRDVDVYDIQSEIHVRVFTLGNKKTIGSKNPRFVILLVGILDYEKRSCNNNKLHVIFYMK